MDPSNSASNTAHTQKYASPPPFTAQEFWAKVAHLLGEKKGYVTHEQFEHAFGVKMNHGTTDEYFRVYGVGAGSDWYMKASILETTAKYQSASGPSGLTTNLTIEWPEDAFSDGGIEAPTPNCVRAADAVHALVQSGWVFKVKASWAITRAGMYDGLAMGNSFISLFHYNYAGPLKDDSVSCVYRVQIFGSP